LGKNEHDLNVVFNTMIQVSWRKGHCGVNGHTSAGCTSILGP